MGNKTCNKCGKTGLGWNQEYHKEEGKWMLDYHQDDKGRWCIKRQKKWSKMLKTDIEQCELCIGKNQGWLLTEQAHIKNPNWNYISKEDHLRIMH